jgi:hypothetical protein
MFVDSVVVIIALSATVGTPPAFHCPLQHLVIDECITTTVTVAIAVAITHANPSEWIIYSVVIIIAPYSTVSSPLHSITACSIC